MGFYWSTRSYSSCPFLCTLVATCWSTSCLYQQISTLLFREVGTITYRSGPEWVERFGNKRREPEKPPDFCPDFEIERYLDRQVCATSLAGNDLQWECDDICGSASGWEVLLKLRPQFTSVHLQSKFARKYTALDQTHSTLFAPCYT